MPAAPRSRRYRFGRALLEPDQRRLFVDGAVTPITGRALDLLTMLVERAGELVRKGEILDTVWPGVVVEENNLQVQISALRKVIGNDAIATVPGQGYRLAIAVEALESGEQPADARTNLPKQLTSFIGQQDHLVRCAKLLDASRLLTVTGVGGLGKTRLSMEIANACTGDYADGVWFVDLAPITDPRLVSQAVALALGVAEQATDRIVEAVQRFISNRRILLILDNCEHLLRGCAEIAGQLLQGCVHLKVLATSREPLHLQGEFIYPLPPLSVPDLNAPLTIELASRHDAVRLFVERAVSARPDFALTAGNLRAVCEICARAEGLPLAIELAVARVRVLSVEAIAKRLSDRFRLLKSSDSTAPSRQQTLRATIDWSYDLLAPHEKRLLERLAVFAGGWTLPAAEAVGSFDGIEVDDVLDLLSHLVDKSLVVADLDRSRYYLLETVREYALERLEEAGATEAARGRHLDYYVALAEEFEPSFNGPNEDAAYLRCDIERQNLLCAYQQGARAGDSAKAALRLAYGLRRWIARGAFDVGRPALAVPLAQPAARQRSLIRCRGLLAAAFVSYYRGAYEDALRNAREGLEIAREIGSVASSAEAHTLVGMACLGNDRVAARASLHEAVLLARQANDKTILLEAIVYLAELHSIDGDLEQAEPLYEESFELGAALRSPHHMMVASLNLSRVAISRGHAGRAAELINRAFVIGGDAKSARIAPHFLGFGAGLAALVGEFEAAARFWGASNARLADTLQTREPADESAVGPHIEEARAALGPFGFSECEAAGAAVRAEDATAEFRAWLISLDQRA